MQYLHSKTSLYLSAGKSPTFIFLVLVQNLDLDSLLKLPLLLMDDMRYSTLPNLIICPGAK